MPNPSMVLYHCPGTRSGRVKKLLDLLELPYTIEPVDISQKAHKAADYLAVHPFGVLPALVHDGRVILESTAQMLYLVDLVPEKKLAPPADTLERATYYEWFVLSAVTLEPKVMAYFAEPNNAEARAAFVHAMKVLQDRIVYPYCMSVGFTAVDVLVHWNLGFILKTKAGAQFAKAKEYYENLKSRLDWEGY